MRLNLLAGARQRATLELVGGDLLGVSAEMGLTVEIDGSAVGFGRIHLPSGGDIRVGPVLLRIRPKAAGIPEVSIDSERGEDDAVLEKIALRRLQLASVMPGKRPMAWI